MLRKLLSMTALLGFILPSLPPKIPPTNPNTEYKLYLPLSINTCPYVEAIILGHVLNYYVWMQTACVWGYTIGLTPSAVYSVTLGVDVLNTTWVPTETHYITTDYISPTLGATLPDQKNPFNYCRSFLVTESGRDLGDVKVLSTSLIPPNGQVIYPLTVTSWTKDELSISGTLRNDSGHRLKNIRVAVVTSEDFCNIYEVDLDSTTLDPDEKTRFTINQFYCTDNTVLEIPAQGVAEP